MDFIKTISKRIVFQKLLILLSLIITTELFVLGKLFFASPKSPLLDTYISCLNNNKERKAQGQCLQRLAIEAIRTHSTKEIESVMLTLTDPKQKQWCHEFMHYAGWELHQKTQDLYEAFILASDKCDSGMYHGVVEKYVEMTQIDYNPKDFIEKLIPTSCEKGFSKRDLPIAMRGHCYHGLGHAFMFITDNDLNQSLVYCDVLKGHEESCYAGVFMENTLSKQVGKSTSHVSKTNYDLNNPDYPCNRLEQKYKNLCYIYKGSSNILFTNIDSKQSVVECMKVSPSYQEKCFWGIGMNIPGPHLSSRAAGEKCNETFEINPKAYKQCILGAMAFLTQLTLGSAREVVEFCDAIKKDYKSICYAAAGRNLMGWTTQKESLKDKCEHFSEPEAVRICFDPENLTSEYLR